VKKTNEWIFNKAGIRNELLKTVKAKKLPYYGHTMRKQGSCLEKGEKEIMKEQCQLHAGEEDHAQPGYRQINMKTWTGLSMEESIRMQRIEINGESTFTVWPIIGSRTAEEQNRTDKCYKMSRISLR